MLESIQSCVSRAAPSSDDFTIPLCSASGTQPVSGGPHGPGSRVADNPKATCFEDPLGFPTDVEGFPPAVLYGARSTGGPRYQPLLLTPTRMKSSGQLSALVASLRWVPER